MSSSRLAQLPGSLPQIPITPTANPFAAVTSILPAFPHLTAAHLTPDALWRDQFALTGSLRTIYSASSISSLWVATAARGEPHAFTLRADPAPRVVRLPNGSAWVEAWLAFRVAGVPSRTGTAIVQLVPGEGDEAPWRIWVLRTILEGLDGCADVDVLQPVKNSMATGGGSATRQGAEEWRFDCVVIGAGQSGLAVGGRLKALGVSYVVLDKNHNVGDNWTMRYKSTRSHLPFDRTFPEDEFQEYLTREDMAKGYTTWVDRFGINVRLDTELVSGNWDAEAKIWKLKVRRSGQDHSLTASHIVFATGAGCSVPVTPSYPDRELFAGLVLHSGEYQDSSEWKGKHGVVIGTANTGHDIAVDMLKAGLSSVTMVQRSKTYVLPAEYYKNITQTMYSPSISIELADRAFSTSPLAVSRDLTKVLLNGQAAREPERFDALERVGFKVERYGSIMRHLFERLGGHYLDVGASALIAQGLIKVKSDAQPTNWLSDGLKFEDGSSLVADIVIFATGFESDMRLGIASLLGDELMAQIDPFWVLDEEGEMTGECRFTGHPALWMHGGTLGTSRYLSRFIALQIKAILLGTPLERYNRHADEVVVPDPGHAAHEVFQL